MRSLLKSIRQARESAEDAWDRRDDAVEEARRAWRELPGRWRGRERSQTLTLVVLLGLIVAIVVATLV